MKTPDSWFDIVCQLLALVLTVCVMIAGFLWTLITMICGDLKWQMIPAILSIVIGRVIAGRLLKRLSNPNQ